MEIRVRGRRSRRGVAATAVTALMASMLAAPVDAAVGPTRTMTVDPASGIVLVDGLNHTDTYTVTAERGGVVIGSASGSPTAFGTFGALELNHAADVLAPFCWTGVTPQLMPNDVVRVTGPGVDDTLTVQDIAVLTYPEATTGPGGVPAFVVTGTIGPGLDPANVDVFIRLDLNPQPPGGDDDNPEPVDDDTDDWRASTADEGNSFEALPDGTWTATFTTGRMLEDVDTPVNDQVIAAAAAPRVLEAAYSVGAVPVGENRGGNETTVAVPPGAAEPVPDGCPPAVDSAIGHVSPSIINGTNQDSGLQVSGISSASAVEVAVTGPGGGLPLTDTVDVADNGTWSASFPGPLTGDGEFVVTASHDGGASNAPANRRLILRDTEVPLAPVSIPDSRSFASSIQVLLAGSGEIRYTEGNGTQPPPTSATSGRRYTGAILLTQTTTIKAVTVDAAGNLSPVMTRTFTRDAANLPPGPAGPTPQLPPPPDTGIASVIPLAPGIAKATSGTRGGKATATARWRAPLANGAVVDRYQVRALKLRPGGAAKVLLVVSASSDVTKLKLSLRRAAYKFQVRAVSAAGASPWSERSTRVRSR